MSDTSDSEPLEISNTMSEQEYKNQLNNLKEIKEQRTMTLAKIQKRNRLQKLKHPRPLNTMELNENNTEKSANGLDTRSKQLINHSIQIQTIDSTQSQMGTKTSTNKITSFTPLESPKKQKIKIKRDEKPHLERLKRNKKKLY